ncbi:hypothetical protein POM88_047353 [Heracleum sosnowskyi]|uniref:F-box/kelch-repeat protein n=1 Tax=Heracleum sosnowskyi TaxID=360622 RepID=A0AAD8GS12_9APIA|nr:hypothetical protein POM88_047353 [Heracleum sosnowskyi]
MVVHIDTREYSVKLPLPPQFDDNITNICSCNGLVCFTNVGGEVVHIWNPSTRRFKILPAPNKRSDYYQNGIGFGFDSVSDDYKVLRIVMWEVIPGRCSKLGAELYSANDDSWKEIEVPIITLERVLTCPASKSVYSKTGVVYLETHHGLLSFDLHNEVLGFYPYPNSKIKSTIFDFEGSVAAIFGSQVHDNVVPSLWILDVVCGEIIFISRLYWEDSFKLCLQPNFDDRDFNICSCNGLVCLTDFLNHVVYIWNPSTRRFKILHAPNKRPNYFEAGIGFGFDPVSSDYKILRLFHVFVHSSDASDIQLVIKAELYSANDDSWNDIKFWVEEERRVCSVSR